MVCADFIFQKLQLLFWRSVVLICAPRKSAQRLRKRIPPTAKINKAKNGNKSDFPIGKERKLVAITVDSGNAILFLIFGPQTNVTLATRPATPPLSEERIAGGPLNKILTFALSVLHSQAARLLGRCRTRGFPVLEKTAPGDILSIRGQMLLLIGVDFVFEWIIQERRSGQGVLSVSGQCV